MNGDIIVRYVALEPKVLEREYTFNVREAGEVREFTLNIANEAFVSHRARYQDAPAICSLRLNAELLSNHPRETQFAITGGELDHFRATRTPKVMRSLCGWKKAQENF